MKRKSTNPPELFNSLQHGFSQVVESPSGRRIFISGQVAWDSNSNIQGKGDLAVQMNKSLANLELALESIGGTLDNVMMLRLYIVDLKTEDANIISQTLKDTFGTKNPPASTWINVAGLANEDFLIEIEAEAVV